MVTDELFEECVAILQNTELLDEEQTEKVQSLIASKTSLTGAALENTTLDVLWRHREKIPPSCPSPSPIRHTTIIRSRSPAPWQIPRVGTPNSIYSSTPPLSSAAFPPYLSSKSPFPSPKPSPRLAYSSPLIPHSPNLNAYEFANEPSLPRDIYGDYGSENVAWLVNDDANSIMASTTNMSPHDMLRSVLGEGRTDEEIEQALETGGYDLSSAIAALMEKGNGNHGNGGMSEGQHTVIGKSTSPHIQFARPVTPRNGIVCRFFLSTGQCLRADCRFSHDLGTTICKYWVNGNCLAGDTCIFSHDPTMAFSRILDGTHGIPSASTPPPPQLQFHDPSAFPSLSDDHWGNQHKPMTPPPGFRHIHHPSPVTRQQNRESQGAPAVDDPEAFPSLSSAIKSRKKENRHKHNQTHHAPIPTGPATLADVVRMSSPSPHSNRNRWSQTSGGSGSSPITKSKRAAASSIPAPTQIPWLETGNPINKLYLKHRATAIKHGNLRNKYLQAAAAAWNRNDAKSAKSLSLRGANENEAMKKAHRAAAQAIYEDRNKSSDGSTEIFVDLHGLHPDEAIEYLEKILLEQQHSTKPVYAIVGTGHHAKNGKDKVGKAVRQFLDEWRYVYREFSVNGSFCTAIDGNVGHNHHNNKGGNIYGGILGIDPGSYDKSLCSSGMTNSIGDGTGIGIGSGLGSVQHLLVGDIIPGVCGSEEIGEVGLGVVGKKDKEKGKDKSGNKEKGIEGNSGSGIGKK